MNNKSSNTNIFSPSFKLDLSGFDDETSEKANKLAKHFSITNKLFIAFIILSLLIGIPLEFREIDVKGLIPVFGSLLFFARYMDLFKKTIELITHMKRRANQNLEPIVTTPVDEVEPQSTQAHV